MVEKNTHQVFLTAQELVRIIGAICDELAKGSAIHAPSSLVQLDALSYYLACKRVGELGEMFFQAIKDEEQFKQNMEARVDIQCELTVTPAAEK